MIPTPNHPPPRNTGKTTPTVPCDLCGEPFQLPQACIEAGIIHGLLVCTFCVEIEAQSRIIQ